VTARPRYEDCCAAFRWADVVAALGWSGGVAVNLGETLVDRFAATDRVALDWHGAAGDRRTVGYRELAAETSRFASWLIARGVQKGDRVAVVMPRLVETVVILIGTWKAGAVYVPIFAGFGAEAIRHRINDSGARVVCTHASLRDKIAGPFPHAPVVLTVGGATTAGDVDYDAAVRAQPAAQHPVPCARNDPAALIYTSGSTGPSKGVAIATNLVAAIWPAMRYGADLQDDDVFWPTGDPGWGYGLVCYAVALAMGVPITFWEALPTAESALGFMAARRVSNLATVPTLLRGIMALGPERVRGFDIPMRRMSSCGEPLNAEVVRFFREVWDVTVMDQFGSSEQGLPVGNLAAADMTVKAGSMGRPMPGHRVAVLDDAGAELPPDTVGLIAVAPDREGTYALDYWNAPPGTPAFRRGAWIVTGDLGRRDADGYLWFEGRNDDVIKSAGYRIGPFEVESAILTHPAVAEAAVVGKPDALRGQIVAAFVVLRPGERERDGLAEEIVATVRRQVGAHQYPRAITFVPELPKTTTGKIQRFKLREMF
jgi:acetyl-CoA synthetase